MAETSAISWTDATFNPWWGCVKVSPACDNCYAERDSKRYGFQIWGKDSERRFFGEKHWDAPLKWDRDAARQGVRRRVFCASMADVMEDRRDLDATRDRLWQLIGVTPHLDWLLLTKRPMNFRRFLPAMWLDVPASNVWLMTTCEAPEYLWRVEELLKVPAVVHGVSYEPATAAVDFRSYLGPDRLNWIVCGGESGPKARSAEPDWFRAARDASVAAGTAFHFKQWGEYGDRLIRIGKKSAGRLLDGREWNQFPFVQTSDKVHNDSERVVNT